MKIATWNLERLKHKKDLPKIQEILSEIDADILVLTETDGRIILNQYPFKAETKKLSLRNPNSYQATERSVSIFSKYEILQPFSTFDELTSCCIEVQSELGKLRVYGTIIGIYGNRHRNFKEDLAKQLIDFQLISSENNFCIAGDFNISFADNYYFTNAGRTALNQSFENHQLQLLTQSSKESIDHIAISKAFVENLQIEVQEWNEEKRLSDHKGIAVRIFP